MRFLDPEWSRPALAIPVFFAAVYGVYTVSHFWATDVVSIFVGVLLGVVVSFPFGLLLGYLAILSGQLVLAIARRSSIRAGTQRWRVAFSASTGVAIAVASAAGAVLVNVTGPGFISVGVIGIIAFASAYFYFPTDELEASQHASRPLR